MARTQDRMDKIIAKAWSSPAFKQNLLTNPVAALKTEGIGIPPEVSVRVVENTPTVFYLVLPHRPTELSEQDLEKVVGGLSGFEINVCPFPENAIDLLTGNQICDTPVSNEAILK